jgi:coenzyme F420-0:L-glutamate ligase/coenzyme F420-1:gamma-L-glutamate ligase
MTIEIVPLRGVPVVHPGDDLAAMLAAALLPHNPRPDDILVVTHKIVSKAEGAVVAIDGEEGYRRVVEAQAAAVIRRRGELVITVTRHGFVCASAGVDRSNAGPGEAVLLPVDPDASAHRLRRRLAGLMGVDLAVIVTDTFGRAWRKGLTDVAIGVSGMVPVLDLRGAPDMFGRTLEVTEVAIADEVAAAADLAMGKSSGIPAALVRGVEFEVGDGRGADLVRPVADDLFR